MATSQKEKDIAMMLAAKVHQGTKNCDFQMERYIFKRRKDGINIINLAKTWDKLQLAARIIVAIENPADVVVLSARPYGQRAVYKFGHYTGAKYMAGRHTPGTFTNQSQKNFEEPRLLIVTDPRTDHQSIKEASYVNIPTIAFCDSDSPLSYVDVAIPANNKGLESLGVLYWLLARMVLTMRGTISPNVEWDVMVDLFFFRQEEVKEEGEADAPVEFALEAAPAFGAGADGAAAGGAEDWGQPEGFGQPFAEPTPAAAADDWGAVEVADPSAAGFEAAPAPAAAPAAAEFAAAPAYAGAGY